ncbi:MAG: hypothetical protein Q4D76_15360 [Oscillospiraceae bacterium]|nr:hypothetical protein [Oscillospiraceae bacterium]
MDEKILETLTQMQADIITRFSGIESELRNINQRLSNVENELASVKEDTEITRTAVNTLVEWVDQASVVLDIRYPVNH